MNFLPRFVILEHDHPRGRHYDFMLEVGNSLKTWALAKEPIYDVEQQAKVLPDHRLAYLDYEGSVSNDRGSVKRWDKGTYQVIEEKNERMVVELLGEKICCQANIENGKIRMTKLE